MAHLPGFDPSDEPIPSGLLDGAEGLLGVRFPAAFRAIAARYDGATGEAAFAMPTAEKAGFGGFSVWLSLKPWAPESVWSWLGTWQEHGLPTTLVPFGENGGGDLLCLDYRGGAVPAVVLWFHELPGEEGIFRVSDSFEHWLASVRPEDDG